MKRGVELIVAKARRQRLVVFEEAAAAEDARVSDHRRARDPHPVRVERSFGRRHRRVGRGRFGLCRCRLRLRLRFRLGRLVGGRRERSPEERLPISGIVRGGLTSGSCAPPFTITIVTVRGPLAGFFDDARSPQKHRCVPASAAHRSPSAIFCSRATRTGLVLQLALLARSTARASRAINPSGRCASSPATLLHRR